MTQNLSVEFCTRTYKEKGLRNAIGIPVRKDDLDTSSYAPPMANKYPASLPKNSLPS